MRIIRWMCAVKVKDRVPSKALRKSLVIDDIISILQQNRLYWYRHVLRIEGGDWVKKCIEYEVDQVVDQRGFGQRLFKKTHAFKLNREDAMDHSRWSEL